MIKLIYFKTDIKKVFGEPIIALLFIMPLFFPLLFKALLVYAVPIINNYIAFDIVPYHNYVLAMTLMLAPSMLGAVMGFTMLDDKDSHIVELMSVTPLGTSGYMMLKIIFVFIATFIATIYTYYVMNIFYIPPATLVYLALLLSLFGSTIGMVLFTIATDKVKGLTYTKALSLVMLFAFADLVPINAVRYVSMCIPTYWITQIMLKPQSLFVLVMSAAVHLLWFGGCFLLFGRLDRRK